MNYNKQFGGELWRNKAALFPRRDFILLFKIKCVYPVVWDAIYLKNNVSASVFQANMTNFQPPSYQNIPQMGILPFFLKI